MFNKKWMDETHVNECAVNEHAKEFNEKPNKVWRVFESLLLLKAITLIDLSTLAGDDTDAHVISLVNKAVHPLQADFIHKILNSIVDLICKIQAINVKYDSDEEFSAKLLTNIQIQDFGISLSFEDLLEVNSLLKILGFHNEDIRSTIEEFLSLKKNVSIPGYVNEPKKTIRVAAICVYPKFVGIVKGALEAKGLSICENKGTDQENALPIASVAAGFPTGQFDLSSKVEEILFALSSGATEIDIVISRCLVLGQRWQELFDEILALKKACGSAKMKTILGVGECGSLENVYKASMVAMMAGSDYIKTSTGKETVNATLPVGVVMCRAVRNFYIKTGKKVGFKPAGGIKTADDTLKWLKLIVSELGSEWLAYFRIGASSLLDKLETRLMELNP